MTRPTLARALLASLLLGAGGIITQAPVPSAAAATATATRLVLAPAGAQPDGEVYEASMTPTRSHLVFTSSASNLVPDDQNGVTDVFVKTMATGAISRISLLPGGGEADADSYEPSICGNGRYVTFTSDSDLFDEENDFNFEPDVYLVDRDADGDSTFDEVTQEGGVRVARMSVGADLLEADFGGTSGKLSDDCRWVTFMTGDSLVEADSNGSFDVYVRSTAAGEDITRLVSGGSTALGGGGELPTISATGRYVVFGTTATDMVPGSAQGGLVLHDRDSDGDGTFDEPGATAREHVSKSTAGAASSGAADAAGAPSISPDGRCVAFKFVNGATLTTDAQPNAAYVRDRQTGTTVLASKTKTGLAATEVGNPRVSPSCRYVTFDSGDSALAPNDPSPARDTYVKDLTTGDLERTSITAAGAGASGPSESAQVFDDTAALVVSSAPEIAGAQGGTGARDPFLVDFEIQVPAPTCTPGAPAVQAATRTSVTLGVAKCASPGSGPAPTGYRVLAFAGADTTPAAQVDVAASAPSATVPGLVAGTRYRFRTAALNGTTEGPRSALSAWALPPFRTFDAFTDRQYRDFAGRAPTAAELTTWRNGLTNGTLTPTNAISQANDFGYWSPRQSPVTRLFRAYFLRLPDKPGLDFWANRLRAGGSLDQVSQSFAGSAEFKQRYGTLTNRQFVERVYQNVLGRPGEASGVTFWTQQLDQRKRNRGQVMTGFSESAEYKAKAQRVVDTVNLFTGMLRRVPTTAEAATWAPTTGTPPTKAALIAFLLASQPYDDRV